MNWPLGKLSIIFSLIPNINITVIERIYMTPYIEKGKRSTNIKENKPKMINTGTDIVQIRRVTTLSKVLLVLKNHESFDLSSERNAIIPKYTYIVVVLGYIPKVK